MSECDLHILRDFGDGRWMDRWLNGLEADRVLKLDSVITSFFPSASQPLDLHA